MAEENTPKSDDPGASGSPTDTPPVVKKEEPTIEELQNSVNAARRREEQAKKELQDTNKRLATLEAEKKKRDEEDLTEKEKLTKELEDQRKINIELEKDKQFREEWEASETAFVEKESDGLTDSQKSIVNDLPLIKRRDAIAEFKAVQGKGSPYGGKGGGAEKPLTSEELMALRKQHGPGSLIYLEALAKHRKKSN